MATPMMVRAGRKVTHGSYTAVAQRLAAAPTVKFTLRAYSVNPPVKTFGNQHKIPRLPISSLKHTAEKYLETCRPLLSSTEFKTTEAAVQEFVKPGGFGEVLQARLKEADKKAPYSWLEDIWLKKAYLEWREPSLINVNWWGQLVDHPDQPKELLKTPPAKGVLTEFQIKRAAGIISNLITFKQMLDKEELPAEHIRSQPVCMNQYKNQFGVTRLPGETCDTISQAWPVISTHIIVLVRDQIYKVEVIRPDGSRLPLKMIENMLHGVDRDSKTSMCQPAVGVLTGGHRDTWFKAYERLKKISPTNLETFETIRTSLFAVCLDDHSVSSDLDSFHHQIFHNLDAHNRWFDKAIQIVVASSGKAGINGEHTPADAVVPGRIMEFVTYNEPAVEPKNVASSPAVAAPQKLHWVIDDEVKKLMNEAQTTAQALIDDTQMKASPDAYIQLAIQVAWRRLYTEPTAIYESASTRGFLHGRTETGRSLTTETWNFAKSFDDPKLSVDEKKALFHAAAKSQSNYLKEAAQGKGVDRHLLGLRVQIQTPEEAKKATLFQDPAYIKSMYFKLSTSNIGTGERLWGGFGPVVPEGYGINYAIGSDNFKFSISSKRSCKDTDSYKFRDSLLNTLQDMRKLFEA
ncbi:hypothetical protein HDV05_000520 [Chytridiales sp. JEL 0842]|nr:hypothetical protein HDV05_000520 [Chytridiales sp. JEL 0842]